MILLLCIYLILYGVMIGLIVFIGFFIQTKKERSFVSKKGIQLSELTVLIPFRNEENRIEGVLKSLLESKKKPFKVYFIDDHSTDKTVDQIESTMKGESFELLSLPAGITGKKSALRYATKLINTKYVLTIDADVLFSNIYFLELEKLGECQMYLQPAIMKARNFKEYFYEIDLGLVNAVNVGIAGLLRPIMASGANLLYDLSVFNSVDSIEKHKTIASGDDMYLLKDFRENGKHVRLVSSLETAVTTETPQSFNEFLNQRMRWLGKTLDLKDNLATGLGVVQSLFTIVFILSIVGLIISTNYPALFIFVGVKITIDLIVFFPYFNRIKRLKTWLLIPLYELLFPFYGLIILLLMFWYKPKWKGRKIANR